MSHDELATRATMLHRLKANDAAQRDAAWKEFQARYAPVIAGFARKMGANGAMVDDLVQDVVSGFFEAQPRFSYDPAKGRFRGYLKTVTWRQLSRRKNHTKANVALDSVDPNDVAIERTWDDIWQAEQLKAAVEAVRVRYDNNNTFRAFEAIVINGQTVEEVAQLLHVSVDSAYKAKQRVAKALKETLEQMQAEEG